MNIQLKSVTSMICTKLHIPADPPLSNPTLHTKAKTSSHSHNFQPHHFQRDLRLLWMDVTKFDGSYTNGWVTQIEHYLSLYDITYDLNKLRYDVLHLDQERWPMVKNCPSRVCCLDRICGRAL
jgi:hypothetical protein